MKKILCYGDSNTYGYNPENGLRYKANERWSGILKEYFSQKFEIIEEGMNNRTGFVDNPQGERFSSQRDFSKTLQKYDDVYALVLAVGTNDLQFAYDIDESSIEMGLENLILLAQKQNTKVIVIPPVILRQEILKSFFANMFDKKSIKKSFEVQKIFEKIAMKHNCQFFNINKIATPSKLDGLHYDSNAHKIIGMKLAEYLEKIL